jgi:hypothetical protein
MPLGLSPEAGPLVLTPQPSLINLGGPVHLAARRPRREFRRATEMFGRNPRLSQ